MTHKHVLVIKGGVDHRSLNACTLSMSIQKSLWRATTAKANDHRGGTNAPKNASF